MIEVLVGVGVVALVVGGLVTLAIWVSSMRVTVVKGRASAPGPDKEYLSDEDINELLVDESGEEDRDAW